VLFLQAELESCSWLGIVVALLLCATRVLPHTWRAFYNLLELTLLNAVDYHPVIVSIA